MTIRGSHQKKCEMSHGKSYPWPKLGAEAMNPEMQKKLKTCHLEGSPHLGFAESREFRRRQVRRPHTKSATAHGQDSKLFTQVLVYGSISQGAIVPVFEQPFEWQGSSCRFCLRIREPTFCSPLNSIKFPQKRTHPWSLGRIGAGAILTKQAVVEDLLWMDKIHFAAPKKPWLKPLFAGISRGNRINLRFL